MIRQTTALEAREHEQRCVDAGCAHAATLNVDDQLVLVSCERCRAACATARVQYDDRDER